MWWVWAWVMGHNNVTCTHTCGMLNPCRSQAAVSRDRVVRGGCQVDMGGAFLMGTPLDHASLLSSQLGSYILVGPVGGGR